MTKSTKKLLILALLIVGIVVIVYLGLNHMANSHLSGCGMNDGPFTAVLIDQNKISENSRSFKLNNNAVLILDNRNDSLSPTLTLKENGIIKWTLDTDTRNTKGYESEQIWEISNLSITKTADPIKLEFTAHWTYGAEAGWMEINRENGKNSFCLSW